MKSCTAGFVLAVFYSVYLSGRTSADLCENNPCQNGGTCRTNIRSTFYICNCDRMYFGENCKKVSPCASGNPCKNGGSCHPIQYSSGFYCKCPSTHFGKTCEKDNPCFKDQPLCQNGGTCYPSKWIDKGYSCSCPSGYGGNNCQLKSRCDQNPCKNGGTCRDNFWNKERIYTCYCPEYYKGDNCQFVDPCKSAPCQNGASCFSQMGYGSTEKYEYHCSCSNMYYGKNCQHASECQTKICHNGGTCFTYGDGKASCSCIDGFRGPTCQRKYCPVKDTCQGRYMGSSDFNNCTATMRINNANLQTCAHQRYEKVKQLQSCDCMTEDVTEAIRKIYTDTSDEEAMSCLQRKYQEDWRSCSVEAVVCIDVFRQVFGGSTRGCNGTIIETMNNCIDGYERGTVDLSTCPAAQIMMEIAYKYKYFVPMICAGCPHFVLGRNCTALKHGRSPLVYLCSLYDKGEEIIQCMVQEAQRWPHCSSILNGLEGTLRSLVNNARSEAGEACTEYSNYQRMWAEDWGCGEQVETNSKRSFEHQVNSWAML